MNEAPNFFEVFMGKNCAKSRSMKQPFCFILDKKSTIRWSDNKIVCSYTQTEERLSSTRGELRSACPLCLALLAVYTAVFSVILFDTNN